MLNLWSVVVIGVLLAILTARRRSVCSMLVGGRRGQGQTSNKGELSKSLDALVAFLWKQEAFRWASILREIRKELDDAAGEKEAISRLNTLFGGMTSLNDLGFDTPEANKECGKLLDAVFRDMKLYYGTHADRVRWRKLEEERGDDELSPRSRNARPLPDRETG